MKCKLKVWLLCLAIAVQGGLYAQNLTLNVLANAGDLQENNGFTLSWTLGEIATETLANDFTLTQGFQQSLPGISNLIVIPNNVIATSKVAVTAFPNPCINHLNIELYGDLKEKTIQIFNQQGQLIRTLQALQQQQISVHDWPEGMYYLKVQGEKAQRLNSILINKI
ncbi:MAG: T9SS type A sorting domain-containing protein [Bacteroidota bacterium]